MGKLGNKAEIDRIRIALKKLGGLGQAGYLEYNDYISKFLSNGKLDFLHQCLDSHFDIRVSDYPTFDQLKRNTWSRVLELSRLPFLESLSGLYRKMGVYQIGNEIHNALGGDYEIEISETLDTSLSVVATQSKIGLSYQSGKIMIDVLDENTHSIDISSVTWATYSTPPTNPYNLQSLAAESYYDKSTYTGQTTNSSILNFESTVNPVNVTSTASGTDRIDLTINVTHSFTGDLQINLTAPNGRTINAKKQGGSLDSGKNMNVTFTTNNSFGRLMRTNKNDITGTYRMDKFGGIGTSSHISNATEAKQLLTDGSAGGTWSLVINDVGTGNTGRIISWSIDVMSTLYNEHLQDSEYETKIPTDKGGTYQIGVVTKSPYGKFFYRVDIKKYDLLGTIKEIDATELVDSVYYVRSRKVAQVTGTSRIFLEVTKTSTGEVQTFLSDDPTLSEEGNLYERYSQAINFLIS